MRDLARVVTSILVAAAAGAALVPAFPARGQDGAGETPGARAPAAAADVAVGDTVGESRVIGIVAWQRGVWTSEEGSYRRAAAELARVRRDAGDKSFWDLLLLGFAEARLHRRDEANSAFVAASAILPTHPALALADAVMTTVEDEGFKKHAETAASIERIDFFLIEMAKYDRRDPFAAELRYLGLLERGSRHYALGAHQSALGDLREAADLAGAEGHAPSRELALIRIQAHKDLQEYGVAADIADEVLRRNPGEHDLYWIRGIIAAEAKQMDEARRWHERVLEFRPDYAEAHAKLAYIAWDARDVDSMRRHLECLESITRERWRATPTSRTTTAAANLHGGWGGYWFRRGDQLSDAGDLEGARRFWLLAKEELLKAYQETPGCVRSLTQLVQVLFLLKADESEIDLWKQRLEDLREGKPDAPKAYHDTFC